MIQKTWVLDFGMALSPTSLIVTMQQVSTMLS